MSYPPRTRSEADRELAHALALVKDLQTALGNRDRATQNKLIDRLAAMRAPLGDQWRSLADIAVRNGEATLARRSIDLFVEAKGGHPQALYLKAAVLEQSGLLQDAYDVMCGLPANVPDPAGNAFSLGMAALFLGKADEARDKLCEAVRLQPTSGAAWLSLAMSGNLAQDPELAERIIAAERGMSGAPVQHLAPYFYALGKAHADTASHASAYAAFARGASLMKSMFPYDRAADQRDAQEMLNGFTPERIAAIAGQQDASTGGTIFVTGSPRSGTTLVEQILTSHSTVTDGAEIHRLPILLHEVGGRGWPALDGIAQRQGSAGLTRLAKLWSHLMAERFPGSARVVDKSLSTTRLLGLAASVLPEAPLIWMTRNPFDCAWSCYRTFFPVSMQWTYDQRDIAFHFRLEDELLKRWQDLLGERLLVVPYESLTASPEDWIGKILTHCGLTEEPQVYTPHLTARTVTTASVTQVRNPINRAGVGASDPYREYLAEFENAYSA